MSSQVIAFFRVTQRNLDWSPAEIAELYRIEHALLQARVSLQTDRGVTDEGDPWFVFCRADGEVLVHITRFDGVYQLYSSGLASPLKGRQFTDLSKSFVNQIPLQIPIRNTEGTKLFVHPAAMLAIIIGTIFIASDDVYVLSGNSHRGTDHVADDVAQPDRDSSKVTLQGAFIKYIESFLGSARTELASQESSYLNVVCAIATFIVGATAVSGIDLAPVVSLAALGDPEGQPDGSHAAALVSNNGDLVWNADAAGAAANIQSHQLAEMKAAIFQPEQDATSNPPIPAVNSEPALLREEATTTKPLPEVSADREKVVVADSEPALPTARFAAVDLSQPQAAPSSSSAPGSSHANQAQITGATTAAPVTTAATTTVQPDLSNVSIDQLLQHALKPGVVLGAAENDLVSLVLVPTAVATQTALGHVSSGAQDTGSAQVAGTMQVTGSVQVASTAQVTGSGTASLYPMFDVAAQNTLTNFLRTNPGAQAIFDHSTMSVIVVDNVIDSSRPVTVQVWEFTTGATIAIVGHADNPVHV